MQCPDRREFLKHLGFLTAAGTGALTTNALASEAAHGAKHGNIPDDPMGVLVDLTACIGCRRCERGCKDVNGFEPGPVESYDDQSVFAHPRRPATEGFTVINSYKNPKDPEKPVYAKVNCLHCNDASCVSACIVGALRKKENGAVTWTEWKCIGCRYCMVACPFQIPAYGYDDPLTPCVRKCEFCFERISKGEKPGCVAACPREVMVFGKRKELIALAHEKIAKHPGVYENHVYGEHEVGGTSWMYLSPIPFEQAGFLKVGATAPPRLTEAIQHGVFKYWIAPSTWYAFLCSMFWYTGRRAKMHEHELAHAGASTAVAELPHAQAHDGVLEPARAETSHWRHDKDHGSVATLDEDDRPRRFVVSEAHAKPHDEPHGHKDKAHEDHPHEHVHAAPAGGKLLTPGVWILIAMVAVGVGFWLYRMAVGLAASTNLDNQRPWGLWIAMDVGSGIALAGGGFVSAAIFHVFHRERYHTLARSALITALLGYTFYTPGLLADLGRWYKLPITMLPVCWQGNSVLFEVGMCVMIYLNVQYAELTPIICERLLGEKWFQRFPRIHKMMGLMSRMLTLMMPALLCLGVCLSTFHQSSLGNLLVIAPYKLHPLWWSPLSPLFFLLSAIMVGLPMVIFTILFASWCLNRQPEIEILTPLARRYIPIFTVIYLASKIGDMIWRGTWVHLKPDSAEAWLWIVEMLLVVVPLAMMCIPSVTRSPKRLAIACLGMILGVVINRLNVLVLAYHPPYATKTYIPSLTEFMVSMGLIAALLLTYRVMVTYLPILEPRPAREAA